MLSLVNKTLYKTVSFIVLVEEKMVREGLIKFHASESGGLIRGAY